MKKLILSSIFIFAILAFVVSAAPQQITPVKTSSLTSGNKVCEYYQKTFSTGEEQTITVNGAVLNVKYLGSKDWKVNEYQGKLQNHDLFVNNQNTKLKGVRFDFSFMSDSQPEGNLGLTEQDYYPWDCQGFSQSTGLILEVEIEKGWNLIPVGTSLRDCYYALEGELCSEDILVSYYYIPKLNEFVSEKDLEKRQTDVNLMSYFGEENEEYVMQTSKWIYVKAGAENKKLIGDFGASIPNRNEILSKNEFKLYQGWNFLFVDAFMVFDDSWDSSRPFKLDDIKGTCTIQAAYGWDASVQQWVRLNDEFDADMIGKGFIVKSANDCTLGQSTNIAAVPSLPQ